MKDFLIQVEKISGVSDPDRACGIFTKRVSVSDGRVGTAVGAILVKSENKGDLAANVKDVFDLLVKKIEGAESEFLNVLESAKGAAGEYAKTRGLELSFVYTFFFEEVCYIAKAGENVKLLVFEPPKSLEITFESGSGPIGEGQIYLIATKKFLSIFDTEDLKQEAEVDFGDIIDGIATEIAGEEDQSEIGAAFINVKGPGNEKGEEDKKVGGEEIETVEEPTEVGEEEVAVDTSERTAEVAEVESGEQVNEAESTDLPRRANGGVFGAGFREFAKLRHGDIGAVLRLRRNVVILAILAFLILAGSVGYTLKQKSDQRKEMTLAGYLSSAASKLSEGEALMELNRSRAREVLVAADQEIKAALAVDGKNQKAQDLSSVITSRLKETEVSSNVSFSTVSEVSGSLAGLSISSKDLVGIGDGKIFVVDMRGGEASGIEGVSGAERGAVFDNKAFVESSEKVARVDISSEESVDIIDAGSANDIGVFLGNVYLLYGDKISKYVPVEGGYSGPSEYLNSPISFGAKSRFAIDGSVWVTSGKQIFKFMRGQKEDFTISGLVDGTGDFGLIYTNSSLDNLYVVDTTNSALLVIGKDGIYKKVYQAPEFGRATGFVISDAEDEMFVAVGNKILRA